jgi:glucosyl-3-phosphoglycerate phosphatase
MGWVNFIVYGSFTEPVNGKNFIVVRMPEGRTQWAKGIMPALKRLITSWQGGKDQWYVGGENGDQNLWDTRTTVRYEWNGRELVNMGMNKSARLKSALLRDEPMAYGVRHGNTKANSADEFRGWEDFELDEQGLNEAHEAAEWFVTQGVKPTRIISSPLSRARKTAEIIGSALGISVEIEERFKPLNVGEYAGKDKDKTWDEFVHYLDNPDEEIPDGESVHGFADRDIEALDEYLDEAATNGPIILVWHTSNTVIADCYLKSGEIGLECRPEEKDIVSPGGIIAISPTREVTPVFKDVKEEETKEDPELAEHEEYDKEVQEK